MAPPCLPFSQCPAARLSVCCGLFTDIDDTLTADGAIAPEALQALCDLRDAGIPVIAITGRPARWSAGFVQPGPQAWPVMAIVAENGAVALLPESAPRPTTTSSAPRGGMSKVAEPHLLIAGELVFEYAQDELTRAHNSRRLAEVLARIEAEVPGARAARDSPGRITDIAIDHSEFTQLDDASIAKVLALMQSDGMSATVSSIHINGWFGAHDKLSGARWMLRRLYGRELDDEIHRWVYVGDSTNDQTMFAAFPLSVGVANLMRFAGQLHTWPSYITEGERGVGFAEVAAALIAAGDAAAAERLVRPPEPFTSRVS